MGNFRERLTVTGAILALVLGLLQLVHPIEALPRISPGLLIFVALLLGARHASRQQAAKRSEILKEVPQRPLGLSDD